MQPLLDISLQLVLQSPPDGQTQGFEARLVLRDEKADASG